MKIRISAIIFCLALCLAGFSACDTAPQEKPSETTTAVTATSPMQVTQAEQELLPILQKLVEQNIVCVSRLFYSGILHEDGDEPVDGIENAYYVNSAQFPDYAALESYVNAAYISYVAGELLLRIPEGQERPRYFEHEGRLCVNTGFPAEAPDGLDWTQPQITIADGSILSCDFTVTVKQAEGEQTQSIPMRAVLEDGQWRLDSVYLYEEEIPVE